jgi:O-acetylserine/cysteine efflux transporter
MPARDVWLALAVALLWGFNFVVMKVGVGEIPPFTLAALRFFLAAVPLVLFLPRPDVPWRLIVAFGLMFGVVKFGLLFWAMRAAMPAGLSAVVLQTQAIMTVALAAGLLGERICGSQLAGMALAAAGLIVIGAEWVGGALVPFLMVVLAALAWAIANLVAKRTGPAAGGVAFAAWIGLVAAVPLAVLALIVEGPGMMSSALSNVTWRGVFAVLYLAYPVSLLSIAIWNGLLARHSTASVAPFALLVPVFGMAAGAALLGERISLQVALGGLLVLLGLAINVFGPWFFQSRAAARSSP